MDQCLQLKPCANLLRLALPCIVKVGELIPLPQRQQKSCLRSELRRFQARSLPPGFERREIHVRRQIPFSRRGVEILAHAMLPVRKQRPTHVALVEQFRGAMAVVNRQHKSTFDAPANLRDPVACFEPRFRVLALVEGHALRPKILVDRTS